MSIPPRPKPRPKGLPPRQPARPVAPPPPAYPPNPPPHWPQGYPPPNPGYPPQYPPGQYPPNAAWPPPYPPQYAPPPQYAHPYPPQPAPQQYAPPPAPQQPVSAVPQDGAAPPPQQPYAVQPTPALPHTPPPWPPQQQPVPAQPAQPWAYPPAQHPSDQSGVSRTPVYPQAAIDPGAPPIKPPALGAARRAAQQPGQPPQQSPAPKSNAKGLIMLRLAVAGVSVLVAGVLVIVWILKMDRGGDTPDVADGPPAQQPAARQPVRPTSKGNPAPAPKGQRHAASFVESINPWVNALESRSDSLQTSFESLVRAHQRVANEAVASRQEKLSDLDSRSETHKRAMEASARDVARLEDELKVLTAQKAPEIPFVLAYTAEQELAETQAKTKKAWHDAQQGRTKAEEEYRALLSQYYETESDDAKERLEASIESSKKRFEAAQATEKASSETHSNTRAKLQAARKELDTTFAALPASGEYADKLRIAWTAVQQKRKEIEAAETKADEVDRRIAALGDELAKAQSDVTDLERAWKQIHDDALKASRLARIAAERHYKEGTKASREAAEKAIEESDTLDRQDKEAKDAMNEARKAVQDLQRKVKNSGNDSAAAAAEAEKIKAAAQGVITNSSNQIKAAADRLVPRENERLEKMGQTRRARQEAEKNGADAEKDLAPLQKTRDKLETEIRTFSSHVTKMEEYMLTMVREPLGADARGLASFLKTYADTASVPADALTSIARRSSELENRIQAAGKVLAPADLNSELKVSLAVELGGWQNASQEVTLVVQEIRSQADALKAATKSSR